MNPFKTNAATSIKSAGIGPACLALIGAGLLGISLPAQSELKISGHVAYNAVDRDSEDDIVFQRNGFSESRFTLVYEKTLEDGRAIEVVEEFGIGEADDTLSTRRQEVIYKGDFGGFRFGHGNDAGDGNLNGDLSGTTIIQPMASNSAALDYDSDDYNGFDPGRGERIRYDSPRLGDGAIVSAQLGEDDEIEIGLRYNTVIKDGKLRVGAFITNTNSDIDEDSFGILVAYALQNGWNFAVSTSSKDNAAGDGEDGDFDAFKIGYKTGKHAVSLVSGTSENPGNPVETDAVGVAYVYLWDTGIELYAAVHEFDSDDNDVDEDFVAFGTRVKF
jgi:hypothetical protein